MTTTVTHTQHVAVVYLVHYVTSAACDNISCTFILSRGCMYIRTYIYNKDLIQ